MDLKQYKEKIRNELLNDVRRQIEYEYGLAHLGHYAHNGSKRAKAKKKVVEESHDAQADEEEGDHDDDEIEGGKMHFLRHMKHFGRDIKHVANKVGHSKAMKTIGKVATDTGKDIAKVATSKLAKEAGDQLTNMAISTAKGLVTVAPEVGEVALETAPVLLAGDMKKQPKRVLSDKQKRRNELIRKLMKQHGCTLGEASSHIKQNNIAY